MAQILSGSICLSDIPKDKITTGKNGKLYLPVSVFVSNDYKFGNNAGISINQTKEQREAGAKERFISEMLKQYGQMVHKQAQRIAHLQNQQMCQTTYHFKLTSNNFLNLY